LLVCASVGGTGLVAGGLVWVLCWVLFKEEVLCVRVCLGCWLKCGKLVVVFGFKHFCSVLCVICGLFVVFSFFFWFFGL
jgi:hypothetical protein